MNQPLSQNLQDLLIQLRPSQDLVMQRTNHKPACQPGKTPASGQELSVWIVKALLGKIDARESSQADASKDDRILIGRGVLER